MFRVKTTRKNVKRATSPLRPATNHVVPTPAPAPAPMLAEVPESILEPKMTSFFEAESAATSLTKPWLRLERGIRLQKFRAFADAYPGLSAEEKETLYKVLLKANDAKLINTKQQINYEQGVIQSVRGLRMIRTELQPAVFKIDNPRVTKKHSESQE